MFKISQKYAILLVSHVEEIADGLLRLLSEVAEDVTIKAAGGGKEGAIGTSFDKIFNTLNEIEEETVLAFYDLGSARINLEMAKEFTDKKILLYDVSFIEGAYVAASLLQTNVDLSAIDEQLERLSIKR